MYTYSSLVQIFCSPVWDPFFAQKMLFGLLEPHRTRYYKDTIFSYILDNCDHLFVHIGTKFHISNVN